MSDEKNGFTVVPTPTSSTRLSDQDDIMAVLTPITKAVENTTADFSLVSDAIAHASANRDAEFGALLENRSDKMMVDSGHYLTPNKGDDEDVW